MNLLVVSTAPILTSNQEICAYAPMVAELDLWFEQPKKITILAPTIYNKPLLTAAFKRQDLHVISVPPLHFGSPIGFVKSIWGTAVTKIKLLVAMAKADHIHVRCPGNTSLLACYMQILFPWIPKTAKYAGNWDPNARQPISYKFQKWLLSNSFLTRKIKVLVYGDWPNQSRNIVPFFTASYTKSEIEPIVKRDYSAAISVLFVGSLSPGKRPLYALNLIKQLHEMGIAIKLDFYGDGVMREALEMQLSQQHCASYVRLLGNQPKAVVKEAYKKAHFLILPSKSEGWPKAVAEAMFWGCIPMATLISCVPWMLDRGKRGLLLDLSTDAQQLDAALKQPDTLQQMSENAAEWSRGYTLDKFDQSIQNMLEL